MEDRVVFTNPNGSVSVLIPTRGIPIEDIISKDVPTEAINIRQITTADLPQSRLFRNAWDDSNPEEFVSIDVEKAAIIANEKDKNSVVQQAIEEARSNKDIREMEKILNSIGITE